MYCFTSSSAVDECSNFFTSFPTLVIISLFVTILMEVKWNLTVVLICITLMANDVERFFIAIIIHLYVSFAETSFQTLFKNCFIFGLLVLELKNFQLLLNLVYSGYKFHIRYMTCKYFLPFCRLSFTF